MPRPLVARYALGAVPIALRAVVSDGVLQLGRLVLAASVAGLAVTLWSAETAGGGWQAPAGSVRPVIRRPAG